MGDTSLIDTRPKARIGTKVFRFDGTMAGLTKVVSHAEIPSGTIVYWEQHDNAVPFRVWWEGGHARLASVNDKNDLHDDEQWQQMVTAELNAIKDASVSVTSKWQYVPPVCVILKAFAWKVGGRFNPVPPNDTNCKVEFRRGLSYMTIGQVGEGGTEFDARCLLTYAVVHVGLWHRFSLSKSFTEYSDMDRDIDTHWQTRQMFTGQEAIALDRCLAACVASLGSLKMLTLHVELLESLALVA